MSQTPESDSQNDLVFPIVDCPEGHETVAFCVGDKNGQGIALVFCPTHNKILNLHTQVAIKEWLSVEELKERGYVRLA